MFYEFDQNNSGGSFDIDDAKGIGPSVWIEADSIDHANDRALAIGIYFNGVPNGQDCNCCGDRWSPAAEWNGCVPLVVPNTEWDFLWHDTVYVHHSDGTIERLRA